MPGDTTMPFMSVKGDPATWARVGDTIRVVRLKPYGREFDYVVEPVDPSGFAINRTDCRGKGNGEFYGEYPGDYAVVSRAAPKPARTAPAPLAFDAALAALDVEPRHDAARMVTTYDILGLDAVRAAHRAEVERAVREAVEQERAACVQVLNEMGDDDMASDREIAKWERAIEAIRARGVAQQRTGSEAPSASDEGAKS